MPYEEHLTELPLWDGLVIHHSADRGGVDHTRCAYVDNTPDPEDAPKVFVHHRATDGLELDDAEALSRAILAAVEEARS